MPDGVTTIAGFTIPSTDPVFLSIVALHVPVGLLATVSGVVAMVSPKRPGRHPSAGSIYFWSVVAVCVTAGALASVRWSDDYPLFILGAASLLAAWLGRIARRKRLRSWARLHIAGMGSSYVLLLTAFYVDNARQLPLWRALPTWSYWSLPAAIGVPVIVWAMLRHPLSRR